MGPVGSGSLGAEGGSGAGDLADEGWEASSPAAAAAASAASFAAAASTACLAAATRLSTGHAGLPVSPKLVLKSDNISAEAHIRLGEEAPAALALTAACVCDCEMTLMLAFSCTDFICTALRCSSRRDLSAFRKHSGSWLFVATAHRFRGGIQAGCPAGCAS